MAGVAKRIEFAEEDRVRLEAIVSCGTISASEHDGAKILPLKASGRSSSQIADKMAYTVFRKLTTA